MHPATRDKLIRQGFIKVRQLKDKEDKKYCNVYLNSENKWFLSKYPKKPKLNLEVKVSSAENK